VSGLRRVLIANRGEIALRIIRACHEVGIEAVAVYSDADKESRWVQLADAAFHIGGSSAVKSYLNIDAILEAARASEADAVHPGYGFLSERAEFAARVVEAGLVFVGAPAGVIDSMGNKDMARRTAEQAGVPVVPGSGPVADAEEALRAARDIGYPLLVKASAGGGGRGIRPVDNSDQLADVLLAAKAEARSAFGDDTVYLERAVPQARHIEVQIIADDHGNVVHAFERDCSVQRRRQKLLEEAPAYGLEATTREDITAAAVRLAQKVAYRGAGTVEFLLDEHGRFYFMEMNTRIQVEHPISEVITGIDLVAEQLRVAGGSSVSVHQQDIAIDGAAVELRINAEDPDNNFQPCPGQLTRFDLPSGPGVRVDTGFVQGDVISPFYDSLIGKLICWGADREQALARASQALAEFRIEGVRSTVPLHQRLLGDAELRSGPVHTRWLEAKLDAGEGGV